jgi:hypothetical protein
MVLPTIAQGKQQKRRRSRAFCELPAAPHPASAATPNTAAAAARFGAMVMRDGSLAL